MCSVSAIGGPVDGAEVGVFAFVGLDGRPRSCAVTPYLDGDVVVVTSTLALVGKVGAVLRDDRVALLAGGMEISGRGLVRIEDDGEWFDRVLWSQELRKYPPARSLLHLPGHRRLLWWYVGRAVVAFRDVTASANPESDRVSLAAFGTNGVLRIVPVHGNVSLDGDVIEALDVDVPDGPACLLVHEESPIMAELRQLHLRGRLIDRHFHVEHKSGSLTPHPKRALGPLRDLRALGVAAKANRSRLTRWKSRLAQENANA